MFKILTGEKKRRVFSPATIIASVAAHLLLLGGLVYASTGNGEYVDDVICLADCELPPLTPEPPPPPPPPIIEQPTPPARTDEPAKAPAPATRLEVPEVTEVPKVIPVEAPGTPPVDPRLFEGNGPRGPVLVPPTGEPTEPTGGITGPGKDFVPGVDMVEVRPVLDRDGLGRALERNYPPVLRDSRVSGRVVIELIVDENGRPRPGSARVIEASHPAFGEAALRAVDRFRFSPARIGGTPVPVRVTIPIQWTVPN